MKTIQHLFTALLLLCTTAVAAHDFEIDGIYYNITDATNKTVAVTYKGSSYSTYSNEYTGGVVIPESVTYNGTTYSVTSIGESAFYGCSGLTSVTIGNSVTSIGNYAFYDCSGLTSVTIGNSVTSIGYVVFYGCTSLKELHIADGEGTLTLGYNGSSEGLFYDCPLETLYLGRDLSYSSIYYDGYSPFYNKPTLTSVTIGNSVTSIGNYAFLNCSGLTSIEIPNSVTSIGSSTFNNCSGLKSVVVAEGNTVYDSRNNCNAIIKTATNTLLTGCQNTVIPNSVTNIGKRAFDGCTGLTSVTIPNSVTSIGDYAFLNCTGLTSVTIGNGVTNIGNYAFYGCSGLTSVTIPNSVTSIGKYAFYDCSGLTSVTIGNSVTSIGNYAFEGCSGLTNVHISDLSAWCNIDFTSSYANPLFYVKNLYLNNELVTELTIPDNITEIKNYAFYGCSGLTSVDIIDGVKTIGNSAFDGCSSIESLYISNTIETIGDNAFAGCNNIFEIRVGSKKAVTASENVFSSDVYNNACLYVPTGRKFAYERTTPWNNFYIVEMDFTGIDEMPEEVKAESGKVKTIYDLNGRVVDNPTNGIYIQNGKKVFVK